MAHIRETRSLRMTMLALSRAPLARFWLWAALPCAAACNGDTIDLGSNTSPLSAVELACVPDAPFDTFLVQDQAELDALAGCEAIDTDLVIAPFENPDFSPLASLRRVGGRLELGTLAARGNTPEGWFDRVTQLIADGWIDSLDAFQALEQVGNLKLVGLDVPSLEGLSNLRQLTNGGELEISECHQLRDLRGLEGLSGIVDLIIRCDSLESLAGLSFPTAMGKLHLEGLRLADIGAFDVQRLDSVEVRGTALITTNDFNSLREAREIVVASNEQLLRGDGFGGVAGLERYVLADNPLVEFTNDFGIVRELEQLVIINNASLTALPGFPALSDNILLSDPSPRELATELSSDLIEIVGNARLTSIELPDFVRAGFVAIEGNTALEHLSLASMKGADHLSIAGNPALQSVDMSKLVTVDELRVIDNPLLELSIFEPVQTFERVLSSGPVEPIDGP